MCGIAGLLSPNTSPDALTRRVKAMADAIAHRGPDGDGIWTDPEIGLGFGHRRLAILDPTPAGAQPMRSPSGRYEVVYNGELYSFPALRDDVISAGGSLHSGSDTEAMLAGFDLWGIEATLPRMQGIFAIALWDRRERLLHLIRDRTGIKPLYWGSVGEEILFASELKAIRAALETAPPIDPAAYAAFLETAKIPNGICIYQGFRNVPPGGWVTIPFDAQDPVTRHYWHLGHAMEAGRALPAMSDEEAVEALDALLAEVVAGECLSDVPLGAFLSGGIDSTSVVAQMARHLPKVQTFTIGFAEAGYDESADAAGVARHLGTDHTSLMVTAEDALSVIPSLAEMYDEPFADSSQIPTYLVSRLARTKVTVTLSGDGGDEGFAGYNRHVFAALNWPALSRVPGPLRKLGGTVLGSLPPRTWDALASPIPKRLKPRLLGEKLHKAADALRTPDDRALYDRLIRLWPEAPSPHEAAGAGDRMAMGEASTLDRFRAWDTQGYLPDDVLVKVDRASMAVALEARVPLLDPRVLSFAWGQPANRLVRGGKGKWLLREVLARHVPREMFERPKMGFALPIADWLRGPLRDWAEDLLSERSLGESGLHAVMPIREAWAAHLSGRANHQHALWCVLMGQAWLRRWGV